MSLHRVGCLHHSSLARAVPVIRWGADASNNVLRQRAGRTPCGWYHGQKSPEADGKSWEALVLADFADLRKAGLTNPLMDEIEKLFAAAG